MCDRCPGYRSKQSSWTRAFEIFFFNSTLRDKPSPLLCMGCLKSLGTSIGYRLYNLELLLSRPKPNQTTPCKQKIASIPSCEFLSQIPNGDRLLRPASIGVETWPLFFFRDGHRSPHLGCSCFWNHTNRHHSCQLRNRQLPVPEQAVGRAGFFISGLPSPWLISWHYTWAWDGFAVIPPLPQLDPCPWCDFLGLEIALLCPRDCSCLLELQKTLILCFILFVGEPGYNTAAAAKPFAWWARLSAKHMRWGPWGRPGDSKFHVGCSSW